MVSSYVSTYTGWNQPLLVTLTATENQYLVNELPVRGLLQVLEMRTDGYAMPRKVRFQKVDHDGKIVGAPVMVDDAEWTYVLPEARRTR